MYKLLFEKFLQQFIKTFGRKPQTRNEIMSIQDDVVRYLNKTKGVPEGPKKPPFQGFKPTVIQGGKSKEGITSIPINKQIQDLKTFGKEVVDELNAPIKPDLEVIKGGKKEGLAGIEQRAKKIEDINKKLKTMQEEKTTMYPGSVKTESGVEIAKKRIFEIDDELEKLSYGEGRYSKMSRKDRENEMLRLQGESSDLQKIPGVAQDKWNDQFQNFQMNITKNSPEFNQDLTKKIINREMFKEATTEQRKQVLDALDFVRKNPEDIEPFASGGIAGQMHLNRPGYSNGKKVDLSNLESLKGLKRNDGITGARGGPQPQARRSSK